VIPRKGEEGATFADWRADLVREEGDIDGAIVVWRRVLVALNRSTS
jgi:hypothetical protein